MPLLPSLSLVAALLLLFSAVGWIAAAALLPPGRNFSLERVSWAFAIGLGVIAVSVALAFATRLSPGWFPALAFGLAAAALGSRQRLRSKGHALEHPDRLSWVGRLWLLLLVAGVAFYSLRALTEPMWSNDFLAIWGLKGKMIFFEGRVSERLLVDPGLRFSHPEYPLGMPFLFAGLAFLLRRWDDHAMALLFPALQIATLFAVVGWLRRRQIPTTTCVAAAALLALFDPLYAPYITGYADVPLSFFALLLATSLSDAVDETDAGALRRLAIASAMCTMTKNEGLYFVCAGIGIGIVALKRRKPRPVPLVAALLLPAAALAIAQRLAWGSGALADYDFGLLRPSEWTALGGRVVTTASLLLHEALSPGTPPFLLLLLGLFLLGRRTHWADRVLVLALCAECAYLVLPAFAVYPGKPELGPAFTVTGAFRRTSSALGPLIAVGIAGRLEWLARSRENRGRRERSSA